MTTKQVRFNLVEEHKNDANATKFLPFIDNKLEFARIPEPAKQM